MSDEPDLHDDDDEDEVDLDSIARDGLPEPTSED